MWYWRRQTQTNEQNKKYRSRLGQLQLIFYKGAKVVMVVVKSPGWPRPGLQGDFLLSLALLGDYTAGAKQHQNWEKQPLPLQGPSSILYWQSSTSYFHCSTTSRGSRINWQLASVVAGLWKLQKVLEMIYSLVRKSNYIHKDVKENFTVHRWHKKIL